MRFIGAANEQRIGSAEARERAAQACGAGEGGPHSDSRERMCTSIECAIWLGRCTLTNTFDTMAYSDVHMWTLFMQFEQQSREIEALKKSNSEQQNKLTVMKNILEEHDEKHKQAEIDWVSFYKLTKWKYS